MEKRIGVVAVVIQNRESAKTFNSILGEFHDMILGRQGLPLHARNLHVISLIVEGTTDEIGAMTGKIGRLAGVQVRSVLTKGDTDERRNSLENLH
ncbi:MAG: CopG family transcriptional regulator [Spirochaetales bacterium]|nr:CopG family transcriptional regulator [Spirochaetales bacterium]